MKIAVVTQPYYPQNGGVSEHVHHTALEPLAALLDQQMRVNATESERADGRAAWLTFLPCLPRFWLLQNPERA